MDIKQFNDSFFRDGYVLVEGCISTAILDEAKGCIEDCMCKILGRKVSFQEGLVEAMETYRLSDLQVYMHSELQHRGIRKRMLLQSPVIEKFMQLLGPDLCYGRNGQIAINLRGQKDAQYFKKWHQEMWSGAGLTEAWIWLPIHIDAEGKAGMEFMPGSHLWGLIPNRNREPIEIPKDAPVTAPAVKEGDAVFFHSLTLHSSLPNPYDTARVAIVSGVRNFTQATTNNEEFLGWTPFHLSPFSRIRRALGNKHLTPFRTYGGKLSNKDDGKKELPGLDEYNY